MIDQLERVRGIVKKITYKPGWRFNVASRYFDYQPTRPWDIDRVIITITAPMPNLNGDGTTVDVISQKQIECLQLERMKDEDILDYWITHCILDLEKHEMDEWLKFDGFHVREPHPENKSEKVVDKDLQPV